MYAILPVIVFGFLTWFFPVGYGMVMSLTDWNPMSVHAPAFVGLENYRRAFTTPVVWIAFLNSAKYAALTVGVGAPLALILAMWLNGLRRGRGLLRLVFFLPVVTSMIATAIMWKYLYQPRLGIFNGLLMTVRDALGLSFALPRYLLDPRLALMSIAAMAMWKNLGFTVVIFMAGLSGIPAEYYDAARIDGAGPWALFRHITLPLLFPVASFTVLIRSFDAFRVFDVVWTMTAGGPGNATEVFGTFVYRIGLLTVNYSEGAAAAMIGALIIMVVGVVVYGTISRIVWGRTAA